MKQLIRITFLACLLVQAGCMGFYPGAGKTIRVIDTIDGQDYVVTARIGKDGKFENSVTNHGRIQTISGQVTEPNDRYVVTMTYVSKPVDGQGMRKIQADIHLQEGVAQDIGGIGSDVVRVKITVP